MNAEPAGSDAVTAAPEPTKTATPTEAATPPADTRSADMVRAILLEDGQPQEVVEKVAPTEDKPNADTRTPASDHPSEEIPGDRPDKAHAQTPKPKGEGEDGADKKPAGDKSEEVSDEEKKAWPQEALARIHKLSAQKKTLQADLEKAKGAPAAPTRATPTAENPLADVESIEELREAARLYNEQIEWLAANPDGANDVTIGFEADGKTPIKGDLTPAQISKMRAKAERILREAVPQRAAMLQEKALHDQVARQELPGMFEEGTEAKKFHDVALRDIPGIRNLPGATNMIRWAYAGQMLDQAASPDEKLLAAIGADNPELQTALATVRKWIGLRTGTVAGKNGKNGHGKVDPKLEPFLQGGQQRLAPGVPGVRSGGRTDASRKVAPEKVAEAEQRVAEGDNSEEAGAELIGALRESQSREGAPLV